MAKKKAGQVRPKAEIETKRGTTSKTSTTQTDSKALLAHRPKTSRYDLSCDTNSTHYIRDQRHLDQPLVKLPIEHAQPASQPKFTPTGRFPFMDLPGELRNRIYEAVIPTHRHFDIVWLGGSRRSRTLTYQTSFHKTFRPTSFTAIRDDRRATHNPRHPHHARIMAGVYRQRTATALLWVCRGIYPEAASVLYSQSSFSFSLISTLVHFLNNLSSHTKSHIRNIAFSHTLYGHPRARSDRSWKVIADKAYTDICWRLTDECVNLTHLTFRLNTGNCGVHLGLGEHDGLDHALLAAEPRTRWMHAILAFCDLPCLQYFQFSIENRLIDEDVLDSEREAVRRFVLADEWTPLDAIHTGIFKGESVDTKRPVRRNRVLRLII